MNMKLPEIAAKTNPALETEIKAHLDDLTKPLGALGRLEELAMQFCLVHRNVKAECKKLAVFTFAGDHGITAEGVAPFPSEVTTQMVMNMAAGGAAVSVMCREAGIEYKVVDVGVASEIPSHPSIVSAKVAKGTKNFAKEAAMTAVELEAAFCVGFNCAANSGTDLLGMGEMGIGNSSSAAALYALLLDLPGDKTVGAGTGSAGAMLDKKRVVIADAVAFHKKDWDGTAFDAMRRVGGLELAAMAGFVVGAASVNTPVVVDGFISSAAAFAAMKAIPNLQDYLIFSHASAEVFHKSFLDKEGIVPVLDLGMRLGEGTGAVLAMQIIKQAMACYSNMATFSSAGVSEAN